MSTRAPGFRLLLLADTHLGFDQPVRPRVKRRRRGPDFLANFRRALADAVEQKADLVLHGGDLFFRSKVPESIVDVVYDELLEFADSGIPLVIVPGNHERSRLPESLFLRHPNIHVFDSPTTLRFELGGARVALAGFPSVRRNVRDDFSGLVAATGWRKEPSDVRLLCLHQAVEGATVGPSDYVFRHGQDVIRVSDVPPEFHAVLAGHIHRHQVLAAGSRGSVPVVYPGSTERTSFAEAEETKGYCVLSFGPGEDGWKLERNEFVPLPARPMVTVKVPDGLEPSGVPELLALVAREAPADAILRFTCGEDLSRETRGAFGAERLAAELPPTVNVQFGSGFFGGRRRGTRGRMNASDGGSVRRELAREIRETVPAEPGVYAFTDGDGLLLYVGKSVNLRQRMGSYFGQRPTSVDPHLGRLVSSIRSFAWWRTRSELLALLLEDAMIKEFLPPHNTRQREFPENVYLELTAGDFPSCLIVGHSQELEGRETFGPYKDKYFAERLLGILGEAFGIRTCRDPEPVAKCLENDLGRCSGPCRDAVEPESYAEIVERVREFLRGNASAAVAGLSHARDGASEARRFEEASRLQKSIETCLRFERHTGFARQFESGRCEVDTAEVGLSHTFELGALVEPLEIVVAHGRSEHAASLRPGAFDPESAGRQAAAALRRAPSDDDRFLADRARIVCGWVARREEALDEAGSHREP